MSECKEQVCGDCANAVEMDSGTPGYKHLVCPFDWVILHGRPAFLPHSYSDDACDNFNASMEADHE